MDLGNSTVDTIAFDRSHADHRTRLKLVQPEGPRLPGCTHREPVLELARSLDKEGRQASSDGVGGREGQYRRATIERLASPAGRDGGA